MRSQTKTGDYIYILKGANKELSDINYAFSHLIKDYNAEGGAGFYLIHDADIAKKYAYVLTDKYGGVPTLNYYILNIRGIKENLKQTYLTDLNAESMSFVGDFINNFFPEWCIYRHQNPLQVTPQEVCHDCTNEACNRNADYIEVILSDCVDFNLNDILTQFVTELITEQEAVELINEELIKYQSPIRIQIILRGNARDYIEFYKADILEGAHYEEH